jgi:hypothetical protein
MRWSRSRISVGTVMVGLLCAETGGLLSTRLQQRSLTVRPGASHAIIQTYGYCKYSRVEDGGGDGNGGVCFRRGNALRSSGTRTKSTCGVHHRAARHCPKICGQWDGRSRFVDACCRCTGHPNNQPVTATGPVDRLEFREGLHNFPHTSLVPLGSVHPRATGRPVDPSRHYTRLHSSIRLWVRFATGFAG